MATCINCEKEVIEKFCSHCCQRVGVKRITFREGWNDFWARVYGFDGMFPRTLRDLTVRPGAAARTFIAGNRAKYYGPVGYFFLMITLLYLVSSLLEIPLAELMRSANKNTNFMPAPKEGSGVQKFSEVVLQFISNNLKLVSFLYIPIQAFCSRFIFFRKSNYNYLENTILPFYVQGHIYWLSVLSLVMYKITGAFIPSSIILFVSIILIGYANADFFNYQSKIKAFIKGVGVYILSQFFFILIGIAVVIILITSNPEIYELLKPGNNK